MEAGKAPLTEEDVRGRVSLRHQDLADVRTLSLPGTYHEKITHLGSSLKNFTRLKSLDLSRNALTSLEGLHHLTCLEKLNLYFNHISALSEVFRLQTLTALQELDLRLNPVVKNESDYRLFVVHMLPNLRRLDDRPVRDRERKASLLHFTPEQAYEFQKTLGAAKEPEMESMPVPSRAEYVYSLSKKCSVMDEDDEAVLNLMANCEWDLSKLPGVSGSTKRDPDVQFHVSNKCSHLPDSKMSSVTLNQKSSVGIVFLEKATQEQHKRDPYLMFCDEAEAFEKITGHATFTPHPGMNEPFAASEKKRHHPHQKGHEPKEQRQNNQDIPAAASQVSSTLLVQEVSMDHLLDLVDKYWNGCRSLHCNEEFLSQAGLLFSDIQRGKTADGCQPLLSTHQALHNLVLEKNLLQERLVEQEEQYKVNVEGLKAELNRARTDLVS